MKYKCEACIKACILEVEFEEPDEQDLPEFCPFEEYYAEHEWIPEPPKDNS